MPGIIIPCQQYRLQEIGGGGGKQQYLQTLTVIFEFTL